MLQQSLQLVQEAILLNYRIPVLLIQNAQYHRLPFYECGSILLRINDNIIIFKFEHSLISVIPLPLLI